MKKSIKKLVTPTLLLINALLTLTLSSIVSQVLANTQDTQGSRTLTKPEVVNMSAEKLAEAEKLFVEAVTDKKVLGYQILVARRGKVVLHSAGGVRDQAEKLPMTTESLLNLGSMMKSVAAIGLLRLVDQDLLSLDDSVSKHLPGFDQPPSSRITVRQLLLHMPGYTSFESFSGGLTPYSTEEPEAPSLMVEARQLGEIGPDIEPGTIFRYNNLGYNVAGAIIEEISGLKLDQYMKQFIYEPLSMNDTHHDTWKLDSERVAKQYWLRDGEWEILDGTPPPIARANGGLISTAWDFAKFCQMLLDQGTYSGGEIVSRKLLTLATSPLIEVSAAYLPEEIESQMGLQSEWYEYRDSRDINIDRYRGLGFVVSDTGVFSHAGIYGTFFYVDPARELFGLILTQSIYGGNPGQAFIDAVNAAIVD